MLDALKIICAAASLSFRHDGRDWKVINPEALALHLKLDEWQLFDDLTTLDDDGELVCKQHIVPVQGGKPGEHSLEWLARLPDPDEV